jgi:chromosome segregation ATPase
MDESIRDFDAERRELRLRLRQLTEQIQKLKPYLHSSADEINKLEKEVRLVVLRLCEVDREQIEANLAATLK